MPDEQTPYSAATPPPSSAPGTASSSSGTMVVLAYLWLLAIMPLLLEKQNTEVQWHAKHGLVLFVAEFVGFIALLAISGVSGFGCLLEPLAQLAVLILHLACIEKWLQGRRLVIPALSKYAGKFFAIGTLRREGHQEGTKASSMGTAGRERGYSEPYRRQPSSREQLGVFGAHARIWVYRHTHSIALHAFGSASLVDSHRPTVDTLTPCSQVTAGSVAHSWPPTACLGADPELREARLPPRR